MRDYQHIQYTHTAILEGPNANILQNAPPVETLGSLQCWRGKAALWLLVDPRNATW